MNYNPTDIIELTKLLHRGGIIKNIKVFSEIEILNQNFEKVHFLNCIFENSINISNAIISELEFENCEFKSNVNFKEAKFRTKLILKNCSTKRNISFVNTSFNFLEFNNFNCKHLEFKGDILPIEYEDGVIQLNSGKYEEIKFATKEVNCSIKMSSSIVQDLSFSRTNINKSVTFDKKLELNNLFIESSNFYDRWDLYECTIKEITYLHKSNFYEQVVIREKSYNHNITLANIYSKHNFNIDFSNNIGSLDISDCNFDSNLYLNCYNEKIEYENGISCNISGVIHGNIVIENIPIDQLFISAVNFGNIIFNRIKTKLIFLQDFHNNNKLTISNITLDRNYNLLLIYDSNINDTEFVNVNFIKFDEVVIAKSNVSNILLSNCLFPRRIQIETKSPKLGYTIEQPHTNKNIYYRETYRQLKLAMQKQDNRYLALQFKAKEMYHLRKELKFGWDKILLYLNYISNNHGISWIRGLMFTLVVSILFFFIYNFTLSDQFFYWDINSTGNQTKKAFIIGLNHFSNFITSFPKLRIDNNFNTWQTNLSVLASRIFIGYGIYQTITSFRKYGR